MVKFSPPCRWAGWRPRPVSQPAAALLLGALLPTLAPAPAAAVTVFPIRFDDKGLASSASLPSPPFVGQGTFAFDDALADGSYRFDDLSNPALTVVIGSEVFTLADTVVYDPRLAVVIYDNGTRFYFDGPQARNSSLGGSLEITNATFSTLAFEPSGYTPPPYSLYFRVGTTASIAGTYGTLVPAPLPLCGLGVALASARRLRRRRRQGSSTLQR